MGIPIAYLRDDFQDNTQAAIWTNAYVPTGSATRAETGGQLVLTPPTSTAGTHNAGYQSSAAYDLTGDQLSLNVATMVSTSAAVTASLYLFYQADPTQWLRIAQLSGTLYFQKTVGGVTTSLATVTWNASTHKYWRIRESAGTIFFDTSSNSTSWTNRASTTVASAFAVTDLLVRVDIACGNVASPGQFKIDELNAIYPALATTWHMTQIEWPQLWRFRSISLAATSGQGYIATSNDGTTWAYYSGPLGSSSGGYNALTLQSTQAAAQAMAVNLPLDGRWDLPSLVECRFIRLYHRSTTGSSYTLREYYARRLTQADDVETESLSALHIKAASITADRLFVLQLSAITANIGGLNIDTNGYIWQGTGTAAAPTTGLKIFNLGGIGKLSTYNATVEQVSLDTDGKLKAGGGAVQLDASGIAAVVNGALDTAVAYKFTNGSGTIYGGLYGYLPSGTPQLQLYTLPVTGEGSDITISSNADGTLLGTSSLRATNGSHAALIEVRVDTTEQINFAGTGINNLKVNIAGGLNIGTATGATGGQISTSGSAAIGDSINSVTRLRIKGASSSSSDYALVVVNSSSSVMLAIRNDNRMAFFGASEVARPTVSGSRATDTWRQSLMAALSSLGLITDSSTV